MKFYILYGGVLFNPDKSRITPGHGVNELIKIPVPMYVIDHPDGLVVVDTGLSYEHFPDWMKPETLDEPACGLARQLIKLGYDPDSVKYVIMTHLHSDHAGAMENLPKATFIVRREEMKEAWFPKDRNVGGCGYIFDDYKNTRFFNYLELEDNVEYDVFGDGSVICIDTKGHTRGHQSVIVNLPNSGKIIIAADAASLPENLDLMVPPGRGIYSTECGLKAIERLRAMRDEGALVLMGHCPKQWEELKKAPEFYD